VVRAIDLYGIDSGVDEREPQAKHRPTSTRRARHPASILAIVAVVLAAVPCCPFTGLIGAFLGVLALRRNRVSGGSHIARRLAVIAIVAGVGSSIVWTLWLERLRGQLLEANDEAMTQRIADTIHAAAQGDADAALDGWVDEVAKRPTPEAIMVFGEEMSARYGAFDRVAIVSAAPGGSMFDPIWEVACIFHFADASPLGSARFETSLVPGRMTPRFELAHLEIESRERGDLVLGEASAAGGSPLDGADAADQSPSTESEE
jgi:hypothetical protein